MTFNGRCWKRRLAVLVIAASLPSACGEGGSERATVAVCPPVVAYSAELQAQVASEVELLTDGSALANLLSDYAVMRDQARACAG